MKCKKCSNKFKPAKKYHRYCGSCIKEGYLCKKCKKPVFAKKGKVSCCGITESVDYIKRASRKGSGRSLGDILFKMNHGVYPEKAAWDEGEEAYADYMGIPNRD